MNRATSLFAIALLFTSTAAAAAPPTTATAYHITKTVALGAPDRWDYVVFDAASGRVYVAHSDRVTVVDGSSGALIGQVDVPDGATHGIAFADGKGYTDDSKAGIALAFDTKTLKVIHRIKVEPDADGIVFDPSSGHILVIDGDSAKVSVIDPKTDTVVATIDGGGGLEFGVSGHNGKFYVDGAEKNEIVRMDTADNKADAHWPLTGCVRPHGLAIDRLHERLFASCSNKVMVVMNAANGAVLATLPIGEGTDFAEFDPDRGLAFSSNRDGTLSIIAERSPSEFVALPPAATEFGARTMAFNPKTGRIYLATANITVNPEAAPNDYRRRFHVTPGSVRLIFLDPVRSGASNH